MLTPILLVLMIGIVAIQALSINIFTQRINKLTIDLHQCKIALASRQDRTKNVKPQYKYIEGNIDLIHKGQKATLKTYIYPTKMN